MTKISRGGGYFRKFFGQGGILPKISNFKNYNNGPRLWVGGGGGSNEIIYSSPSIRKNKYNEKV